MYNLLEYSDNYSMASRSLWNYFRDEVNDSANENNDIKQKQEKSFEYKTKIIRRTIITY